MVKRIEELNKTQYLLRGATVPAEYRRSPLKQYRENPLIEALPPIYTMEKAAKMLSNVVRFSPSDRKRNATLRAHSIFQLTRFVEPMVNHLKIEQDLSILIRDGYVDRNPLTVNGVRILREGAENVRKDLKALTSQNITIDMSYKTSGSGLTIVGVSGMGKSTAINTILLKMFPAQIIHHGEYQGEYLNFPQIVWLKLECPPSGSTKGLCLNFFQAIDSLLGTKYYDDYKKSRATAVELIPEIAQLCATFQIGALIIDEIQHLCEANTGGQNEMLNFFVTLKNMIGVPVVLIGTLKAWKLLTKEFRQGRRAVEYFGMVEWHRMKEEDFVNDEGKTFPGEFQRFLSAIWRYQWTKQIAPLDEGMFQTMYDFSQGITDVAVKLFMVSQWNAIANGTELITPELIHDVARNELRALYPIIQAFRLKDTAALEEATDVFISEFDVEAYFKNILPELTKKLKVASQIQHVETDEETDNKQKVLGAIKWLKEAGDPSDLSEQAVKEIYAKNADLTLPELKRQAYDLVNIYKKNIEKQLRSKPRGKKAKKDTDELREEIQSLEQDVVAPGQI
ncbi:ATP-binding protein [Paenibacillus tyrfis]|uniref:ATP-binding protein n=1 Tax=Paenibacillus tyrfis TaxID=1501230 RepID=UPI0020A06A6E|nr:ATP-binding protein [Paenibacillus tyrfis]MCP1311553.1 ATP-binding protein [Paenibacillus tyrfis]